MKNDRIRVNCFQTSPKISHDQLTQKKEGGGKTTPPKKK